MLVAILNSIRSDVENSEHVQTYPYMVMTNNYMASLRSGNSIHHLFIHLCVCVHTFLLYVV